jgi:hypothetical protein
MLQDAGNGAGKPRPIFFFFGELLAAFRREAIVARAAVVF